MSSLHMTLAVRWDAKPQIKQPTCRGALWPSGSGQTPDWETRGSTLVVPGCVCVLEEDPFT